MKKVNQYSESVKRTLNNIKSFGGNFRTRSDGIYEVSKMWRVYPNMETRLKRKIVHSYPLFTWNWTKITITHINVSNLKIHFEEVIGVTWPRHHENEAHTKVALESPQTSPEEDRDWRDYCWVHVIRVMKHAYIVRCITWPCLHGNEADTKVALEHGTLQKVRGMRYCC